MQKKPWTEQEKAVVKEYFPYLSNREIKEAIPERSVGAISDQAERLGVKKTQDWWKEHNRKNGFALHWQKVRRGERRSG